VGEETLLQKGPSPTKHLKRRGRYRVCLASSLPHKAFQTGVARPTHPLAVQTQDPGQLWPGSWRLLQARLGVGIARILRLRRYVPFEAVNLPDSGEFTFGPPNGFGIWKRRTVITGNVSGGHAVPPFPNPAQETGLPATLGNRVTLARKSLKRCVVPAQTQHFHGRHLARPLPAHPPRGVPVCQREQPGADRPSA